MRTPVENARATAERLPHSSLVEVPGNGHDQLDTDSTNCATNALKRFVDRKPVRACDRHKSDQQDVLPVPPLSLSDFRRPASVSGDRGRTLFAVMDSVSDARVSALEAVYAGWSPSGGGLRGGSFSADDGFVGRLDLHGYSFLPGLRLTGRLIENGPKVRGRVSVAGKYAGYVQLASDGSATGRLGGRNFSYRPLAGVERGRGRVLAPRRRFGERAHPGAAAVQPARRALNEIRGDEHGSPVPTVPRRRRLPRTLARRPNRPSMRSRSENGPAVPPKRPELPIRAPGLTLTASGPMSPSRSHA